MCLNLSMLPITEWNLLPSTPTIFNRRGRICLILEYPGLIRNRSRETTIIDSKDITTVIWEVLGLIYFCWYKRKLSKIARENGLQMLLIMLCFILFSRCHAGRSNIFLKSHTSTTHIRVLMLTIWRNNLGDPPVRRSEPKRLTVVWRIGILRLLMLLKAIWSDIW